MQLVREEHAPLLARLSQSYSDLMTLLSKLEVSRESAVLIEIGPESGQIASESEVRSLQKMYLKYAVIHGWPAEVLDETSDQRGLRHTVLRFEGTGIFSLLKYERGTHRFIKMGNVGKNREAELAHYLEVRVYPEQPGSAFNIRPEDLEITTFAASNGPGGQHVNKTASAVRIRHIPTGITVKVDSRRSQHANKSTGMSMIEEQLHERQESEVQRRKQAARMSLSGSVDRSDSSSPYIRTYDFRRGNFERDRILSGMGLDADLQPKVNRDQLRSLERISDENWGK
jgi:peptide chain release factor 1